MNIWRIKHRLDERLAMVKLDETEGHSLLDWRYGGHALLPDWPTPPLQFLEGEQTDFPFHDHGVLLGSASAASLLMPLIGNDVEVLPIRINKGDFVLLNVTRVVDCLDYERSEIRYSRFGKRISEIERYAFHTDRLKDAKIFKIPEEIVTAIFCTGEVYDAVHSHGFTGLEFEKLYSE